MASPQTVSDHLSSFLNERGQSVSREPPITLSLIVIIIIIIIVIIINILLSLSLFLSPSRNVMSN